MAIPKVVYDLCTILLSNYLRYINRNTFIEYKLFELFNINNLDFDQQTEATLFVKKSKFLWNIKYIIFDNTIILSLNNYIAYLIIFKKYYKIFDILSFLFIINLILLESIKKKTILYHWVTKKK